jgi:rhamnose transport system ATP-binding protein
MQNQKCPVLQACGIVKAFSGVEVLHQVDFDVYQGEVHALVGENGAGKSTLVKIISGVHLPDQGKIILDGGEVNITSPHAAERLGISLIHQEPLIFPELSVAENIFIGHDLKGERKSVNWAEMYQKAHKLLESLGVNLNPRNKLRGLSIADQQMVELAAALSQNARILIMDEPTASLTPREVDFLFNIVNRLREQGTAIIFIGHRLEEVTRISDRITVLRDGGKVGTCLTPDTTQDDVIRMMVGRPLGKLFQKESIVTGDVLLSVKHLTKKGVFSDISFNVHKGEILGIAGLVGAGRTDVANAVFGITKADSGTIDVNGVPLVSYSPRKAIKAGVAYVPEDRQQQGLLLPFDIASNLTFASPQKISRRGWLSIKKERCLAEEARSTYKIHARSVNQPVGELSGGNQQKVVLGKWLLTDPLVLVLDEPTRGVDIGAKAEVYSLMNQMICTGKGILMISSDLLEVLALSDRIMVMREGQIVAEFTREEATQEKIMAAAVGRPAERELRHD